MSRWSLPFDVAVLGGLALFAVLLVPVLVVQYRRFGRLSARRVLAVSAVCVYAVALVAYTTLPLPPTTENCGPRGGTRVQLVPFTFVHDIARQTAGLGVVATLTSAVTLQVVFNVALFVPFGLLVRRFAGRRLGTTVLLGLLTSLVVEVSQGTALWGLYACSYRVADVDDLIANTTGALVGALLAPRFLAWLPMPAQLVPRRLEPRRVTVVRRWTGMVVDAAVFAVSSAVVAFVGRVLAELLELPDASLLGGLAPAVPTLLAGVATFVVPVLTRRGASLGQRLVWLRPRWGSPPSLVRRLLLAAVGTGWALSFALGAVVDGESPWQLVALVLSVPAVLAVLSVPFTRGSRGLSLVLARADLVDSRSPAVPTLTRTSG
ncbi:hypothetical protein GCM10022197_13890 [Microlunatus spumicola]|uniref:VanZ-like domain-containing protein n=1 Tax=Microlunatus spumicola TaxID=81499 RepID=A0ABP6X325_9ACTN